MINFVCVNWGTKFNPTYTQNLYNMVKRHLTIPHKFIVFTDHVKLHKILKGDIEVRKLTFADHYQGYWNKLSLFSNASQINDSFLFCVILNIILKRN